MKTDACIYNLFIVPKSKGRKQGRGEMRGKEKRRGRGGKTNQAKWNDFAATNANADYMLNRINAIKKRQITGGCVADGYVS